MNTLLRGADDAPADFAVCGGSGKGEGTKLVQRVCFGTSKGKEVLNDWNSQRKILDQTE